MPMSSFPSHTAGSLYDRALESLGRSASGTAARLGLTEPQLAEVLHDLADWHDSDCVVTVSDSQRPCNHAARPDRR